MRQRERQEQRGPHTSYFRRTGSIERGLKKGIRLVAWNATTLSASCLGSRVQGWNPLVWNTTTLSSSCQASLACSRAHRIKAATSTTSLSAPCCSYM